MSLQSCVRTTDTEVSFQERRYTKAAIRFEKWAVDHGYSGVPVSLVEEFSKVANLSKPKWNVLDFGAGTGFLTQALFNKFPTKKLDITAMEPCKAMLDKYAVKFGNVCNLKKDGFDVYGTRKLDSLSNSYDVVISSGVFDHIRINKNVMSEFMRVVKPNGYLAFTYEKNTQTDDDVDARKVGDSRNYGHSSDYIEASVKGAGGNILHHSETLNYKGSRRDVTAGVIIVQKPTVLSCC